MDYQSQYGPDWVTYTIGSVGPHIITKTVAAPHRPVGPEVTYRLEGTDRINIDLRVLLHGLGYTRSAAGTLANQMDPQAQRFGGGGFDSKGWMKNTEAGKE